MKKIVVIFVLAALAAAGGGYWFYMQGAKAKASAAAAGAPGMGGPASVSVYEIKTQKISFQHQLPGRVTPYRQSQVRPQVDGIITTRLFEEGADVKQGEQLYQIDDARYKAALNSALADLKSTEANVKSVESRAKRYEGLVKINAVSRQEYDDVKAQLDQAHAAIAVAQAAVDVAQVNLDYTKVYAPISGRISRSFVTEGTLVTANQSQFLATITQLDPVYVDMQQSGNEAIKLRARMSGKDIVPVSLIVDEATGENYPYKGALKFSEVTVDETAGAIALRALMPNRDGVLLPGLFVRAVLNLGSTDVLLAPQRATTRSPDGSLSLWVVDAEGKAQPRQIEVENSFMDSWIVTSGLQAGDKVVIEGYQKIGPGAPVNTVPWDPPASSALKLPPPADEPAFVPVIDESILQDSAAPVTQEEAAAETQIEPSSAPDATEATAPAQNQEQQQEATPAAKDEPASKE